MTIIPRIPLALCVLLVACAVRSAAAQSTPLPLPFSPQSHALSGNGRFVAYSLNGIKVFDRHTGLHENVSVSSAGVDANSVSLCNGISASGRFVVFISVATNLVTDDTNGAADVFVRDRQTGQTTRENLRANGSQATFPAAACPSISDDGRYVAFGTQDPMVSADTNAGHDVYLRDRTLGTTTLVSVSSTGQVASIDGGGSSKISANGRVVTFLTAQAGQLVPGATDGNVQVIVRDLDAGTTALASKSSAGIEGSGTSFSPTISGNGRYVAFFSTSSNLVAGDAGVQSDTFVHDRQTGETTMVSVSSAGVQANGESGDYFSTLSISYDGRYVAFQSIANNLVPADTNGVEDMFVRDRVLQTTYRATLRGDQSEALHCGSSLARFPSFSDSGIDMVLNTSLPLAGACPPPVPHFIRRVWAASARDFDLDRRADITVFRPDNSTFFTRFPATAGGTASTWGSAGDIPAVADFDGDGRTDYAVFRPSTGVWYWLHSWTNGSSYGQFPWGQAGDVPAPGDYDGDGNADPTVFRPSTGTWFAKLSGTSFATNLILPFGANGDVPVPADYDGDRKMDVAVYRPSTGVWFIRHSSTGAVVIRQWGNSTDITVPGDYDGDALADLAVYRPSTGIWYIAKSTTGFATYDAIQWGVGADVPVAADYNGDGRMDPAVFRPGNSTWWVYNQFALFWGSAGDIPIGGR